VNAASNQESPGFIRGEDVNPSVFFTPHLMFPVQRAPAVPIPGSKVK